MHKHDFTYYIIKIKFESIWCMYVCMHMYVCRLISAIFYSIFLLAKILHINILLPFYVIFNNKDTDIANICSNYGHQ